jgi:hypothetical protein
MLSAKQRLHWHNWRYSHGRILPHLNHHSRRNDDNDDDNDDRRSNNRSPWRDNDRDRRLHPGDWRGFPLNGTKQLLSFRIHSDYLHQRSRLLFSLYELPDGCCELHG